MRIAPGATVSNSIILDDTVIEAGAFVDKCIVDKKCLVGEEAKVGFGDDNTPNQALPHALNTGLTLIGRDSVLPKGVVLGRNVTVHAGTTADDSVYKKKKKSIASGSVIGKPN